MGVTFILFLVNVRRPADAVRKAAFERFGARFLGVSGRRGGRLVATVSEVHIHAAVVVE